MTSTNGTPTPARLFPPRETREAARRLAALTNHATATAGALTRARRRLAALADALAQLEPGSPEATTVTTAIVRQRALVAPLRAAHDRARGVLADAMLADVK